MIPTIVPKMMTKMVPKYHHKMKSAADKTPACRGFVIELFVFWGYFGLFVGLFFAPLLVHIFILFWCIFCIIYDIIFGIIFGTMSGTPSWRTERGDCTVGFLIHGWHAQIGHGIFNTLDF